MQKNTNNIYKSSVFRNHMHIFSFSPFGYEGSLVTVEVDLRRGIPAIDMVGLADGAVRESRERMRAAVRNAGFEFPPERILISLSPADIKKEGAAFDLAIALAVLAAAKKLPCMCAETAAVLVMGELELSGKVRPVRGIYAAAATAAERGISRCIVPKANAAEAAAVPGMRMCAAGDVRQAFQALYDPKAFVSAGEQPPRSTGFPEFQETTAALEFADVKAQPFLVRGLQIAAAGRHNVLAYGAPGCGKTLALQRFPALLPLLTAEQSRPVTRIYSLAGLLPPDHAEITQAPFRMPHQSASMEGIAGGGILCRPGEISLAHNGVLFLDEAFEFKQSVLQTLRVPLESGRITLSRAGRTTTYPAQFQLLAAANPCPCGNFGIPGKICLCSARTVEQYWKKFSAPLLDRMDMRIPVFPADGTECRSTAELRVQIAQAAAIQNDRQGKSNANLLPEELRRYCPQTGPAKRLLETATRTYRFSLRAVSACLKLARTIADMQREDIITETHIREAITYRKNEGGLHTELYADSE